MSFLTDVLDLLLSGLQGALSLAVGFVKTHYIETGLAFWAFLRLFGTTVQTGQKGVLFVFGRVRKELEPGFHPLLPVVMTARKTPVRSVTLDLPRQRLTTADGLVYDVQANIVYRVADPKLALTQIDNLRKGIETILPLIVQGLLRDQTRAMVLDFKSLETELIARAELKLGRWGVTVEQAGFKSIAPTKKTLRLTQLVLLSNERQRVLEELTARGMSATSGVALLGANHHMVSHATARYHRLHRTARPTPPAPERPHKPLLLPGEEPPIPETPTPAPQEATLESQAAELVVAAEPAVPQAPPRPKKTTKGVQPRSWLRLQHRLRLPRESDKQGGASAPINAGQLP